MKKKISIGLMGVVATGILFIVLAGNGKELKLNTVTVREETMEVTVTATGFVQPVDKVEVGTQVSGVIEKIYVDFNSEVKRGQLLAELDKSTLKERLIQAQSSVSGAESDLQFMQQHYDRVQQLYDAKAATQTAYEDAINRLTQAKTSVANAKANLQQAQVNLGYAYIYSPIDGIILHRAVEQGQTVAATFNTPTFFTIANDLKRMKVEADVDEADIGQVQVGQNVRFTVDAYPNDVFNGTVQQIRLQPNVISNVVTYTVIVEAPNPDEKLFPGMTASITVVVDSGRGVVVPVSALKFWPSGEVMGRLGILNQVQEGKSGKEGKIGTLGTLGTIGTQGGQGNPGILNQVQEGKPETQFEGEQSHGVESVWVRVDDTTVRHELETGISDGVFVIVTKGLNVGDTVILSASVEKKNKSKK